MNVVGIDAATNTGVAHKSENGEWSHYTYNPRKEKSIFDRYKHHLIEDAYQGRGIGFDSLKTLIFAQSMVVAHVLNWVPDKQIGRVSPNVWQSYFGITGKRERRKLKIRDIAIENGMPSEGILKKNWDIYDAALIALYGTECFNRIEWGKLLLTKTRRKK